jgi:NTE family protein
MSSMPTTSPLQPPASKGLAVALGSSFFGFYSHTAFMRALHDQGIFPSHMSGTSAGAVAAALCGVGLQGADLEAFVMQRGLRRAFLDWAAPLRFPGVVSTLVC